MVFVKIRIGRLDVLFEFLSWRVVELAFMDRRWRFGWWLRRDTLTDKPELRGTRGPVNATFYLGRYRLVWAERIWFRHNDRYLDGRAVEGLT